jgi:hypothetical protein
MRKSPKKYLLTKAEAIIIESNRGHHGHIENAKEITDVKEYSLNKYESDRIDSLRERPKSKEESDLLVKYMIMKRDSFMNEYRKYFSNDDIVECCVKSVDPWTLMAVFGQFINRGKIDKTIAYEVFLKYAPETVINEMFAGLDHGSANRRYELAEELIESIRTKQIV